MLKSTFYLISIQRSRLHLRNRQAQITQLPYAYFSKNNEKAEEADEASAETERKFNYKTETYYSLLGVQTNASDKELKVAYLKAAKKYHPDVYHGVNKDHFKKINEAFTVLKNPQKRSEYDNRQRIRTQRSGSDSGEFGKGSQKAEKVRDYQDPEFEEAFKKLNTQRLFNQFMARPMRTSPEEMAEELM